MYLGGVRRFFVAICLFLFPASLCRLIFLCTGLRDSYNISPKAKIGFSIIVVNELFLGAHSRIGHFNVIKCRCLHISDESRFLHLNFAKGAFCIYIGNRVWFNHSNKFSKLTSKDVNQTTNIKIGNDTSINVNVLFDLSDNISIGDGTVLAGSGTQVWTHSFYKSRLDTARSVKITKPVIIGRNCYIGSSCGIMPGVNIADGITIGSMTCVSKDLKVSGLYVSQPTRYIEFDPDIRIEEIQEGYTL